MWLANTVLKTKVGGNVVRANHRAFVDGIKARMVHGRLPLSLTPLAYCTYLSYLLRSRQLLEYFKILRTIAH